ncbi:MAG TPA: VOC family protein [Stellaceae bacterium]
MQLMSLGYVGLAAENLADWRDYGTKFLGMQLIDRANSSLSFRMDDRQQRLIIQRAGAPAFFGWEVADAAALDALAARVDGAGHRVGHGTRDLAAQRGVTDLVHFHDPVGNRIEIFHGPAVADEPFVPGRNISGFRTGPLGMGHAVLTVKNIDQVAPFYVDLLGFRSTDFCLRPFKAHFFHINPRHHSLAFIETGTDGIHHLMMELFSLDDVGQGYDLIQHRPDAVSVTLGRHSNDYMVSFYARSPSDVLIEYGWGGRSIDPATWQAGEFKFGPSLWGHERDWLPPAGRAAARSLRESGAAAGQRQPVQVVPGNYDVGIGECPWWKRTP